MADNTDKNGTDKDNGDYLGYGVYAETLWARVISAIDRDRQGQLHLGDDPLVIGIFGEWGAGKSTLLKLIERHAVEHAQERAAWRKHDGGHFSLTVPVFFQPWKYEHEPHLHVPILLHILAALKLHMEQAQTSVEWAQGKMPEAIKQHMDLVVGAFGLLLAGAAFAMDTTVPLSSRVALAGAGLLAKVLPKLNPDADKAELAKTLEYKENGRFFYEMHETLQAITRPRRYAKHRTGVNLSTEVSINFVIFIDDLDRCLPEKAVETLELIKTVFNLESFAFVLALDEEVVERGIGHRYKDYALQNKKPEMPITGFEYLEKIVHLPFRLPGLTRDQARRFVQRYEADKVAPGQPERWWFAPRPVAKTDTETSGELTPDRVSLSKRPAYSADLTDLVLNGFTAWVPRKLVRLIELFHQVQEVTARQGKSLSVGIADGPDARVVAALLMIQLFQPDLYRLVRRKPQAFPLLLAAFATRDSERRDFPDPSLSDVDLWLWVAEEPVGEGNDWVHTADIPKATDAAIARIARRFHGQTQRASVNTVAGRKIVTAGEEAVAIDLISTREHRFRAQNVKLPLVVQILEHRAAQRHAFDSLRLFHSLAVALEHGWDVKKGLSPALNLTISDYFELLVVKSNEAASQTVTVAVSASGGMVWSGTGSVSVSLSGTASGGTQPVRYPDRLFADITSDQPEVQANLVANNELVGGKYLEMDAAQHLLAQLNRWLGSLEDQDRSEGKLRLTRGLRIIAPLVPRELGREFLSLVDDPASIPFHVPGRPLAFNSVEEAKRAADRADLWSALGVDDRFDAKRFHLPKSRLHENVNDSEREPIPGFVRVFEAGQERFQPFEGATVILKPYYLARYLTTVDQYARFIEAGGYGDPVGEKPGWWDTLGWQWRTGRLDSQVKDKAYREHLARRKPEWRGAPMNWVEQQAHGSRPVMQINWFEARAYANWLTQQLAVELQGLPSGYAVRLPTEAQWERAARARDATSADDRQYPWGGTDEKTAHLHANIGESSILRPSLVGLFAPNPMGLYDLSGNVWEWQNNLYQPGDQGRDKGLNRDVTTLNTNEELSQGNLPALRGGAWFNSAEGARASFRDWFRPGSWGGGVGFRVVLSLAE